MDTLRDLVSGQGCDDGSGAYRNPLGRLADHMYRDRDHHSVSSLTFSFEGV